MILLKSIASICILWICCCFSFAQKQPYAYPVLTPSGHTENYFGQEISDPYFFFEEDRTENTRWLKDQQNLFNLYFKGSASYFNIRKKIKDRSYYQTKNFEKKGDYFFIYQYQDKSNAPSLYYTPRLNKNISLLIDPSAYDKEIRGKASITYFNISADNRFVAFCISKSGSDWKMIGIKDIRSGKDLPDRLQWIKLNSIEWKGNGFYYCRFDPPPQGKEFTALSLNSKVYYHQLGTPQEQDQLIYEQENLPKGIFNVQVTSDERFLIIYGAKQKASHLFTTIYCQDLQNKNDSLHAFISSGYDRGYTFSVIDNIDDRLLVSTNEEAANKRLVLYDSRGLNKHSELVPEQKEILQECAMVGKKIICLYSQDMTYQSVVYSPEGKILDRISYPEGVSVGGFSGSNTDSTTIFYYYSFTFPPVVYEYNLNTFKSKLLSSTRVNYDFRSLQSKQVFYYSRDGTRIPMTIVSKKGLPMDSNNPMLIYGYGGYGVPCTPFFDPGIIFFLENGGIFAVPGIRGGGEYGEQWHQAGKKFNKQNVFDDFIAATEYLIREHYTRPSRIAIRGSSNGGLLVAAVINQHPELYKAAIPEMGLYDMLHYHQYTVGYASIDEFGSSDDSLEFLNLLSYSPIHNVPAGKSFPAVYVVTGDHDDRVPPFHSYKYTATLQATVKSDNPVLLEVMNEAGHFGALSYEKLLDHEAYVYTFIFKNLGIKMTVR